MTARADTSEIGAAYASAAGAWAAGPSVVYQRLADALITGSPVSLRGRSVVDLGAGTGTVSRALADAGASVVAVDLVAEMLSQGRAERPPALVAEVTALPMPGAVVDGAAAAFVLNHLRDPGRALAEMGRVTRPGGVILASTFADQPRHPAKVAVDEVAARYGYVAPGWYEDMKATVEPLTASAERVRALAVAVGLAEVTVTTRPVDVGADTPAVIAGYRLSMAQLAPFVAGLSDARRGELWSEVVLALGPDVEPMRPMVVFLAARAPGRSAPSRRGGDRPQ